MSNGTNAPWQSALHLLRLAVPFSCFFFSFFFKRRARASLKAQMKSGSGCGAEPRNQREEKCKNVTRQWQGAVKKKISHCKMKFLLWKKDTYSDILGVTVDNVALCGLKRRQFQLCTCLMIFWPERKCLICCLHLISQIQFIFTAFSYIIFMYFIFWPSVMSITLFCLFYFSNVLSFI